MAEQKQALKIASVLLNIYLKKNWRLLLFASRKSVLIVIHQIQTDEMVCIFLLYVKNWKMRQFMKSSQPKVDLQLTNGFARHLGEWVE